MKDRLPESEQRNVATLIMMVNERERARERWEESESSYLFSFHINEKYEVEEKKKSSNRIFVYLFFCHILYICECFFLFFLFPSLPFSRSPIVQAASLLFYSITIFRQPDFHFDPDTEWRQWCIFHFRLLIDQSARGYGCILRDSGFDSQLGAADSSLLHRVQTGSGVHLTKDFLGSKPVRVWSWSLISIYCWGYECTSTSNTSPWRNAQLSTNNLPCVYLFIYVIIIYSSSSNYTGQNGRVINE